MCPGTQASCNAYDGIARYSISISSRIRLMIACPDWRFGLVSDFMAIDIVPMRKLRLGV